MTNEKLVEFLNDQLDRAESAGTLPATVIAELRDAFADPERVAEMKEKARHAMADLESRLILGPKPYIMQREPPIRSLPPLDEWEEYTKRIYLHPGPIIHSDCIVLLKPSEQ